MTDSRIPSLERALPGFESHLRLSVILALFERGARALFRVGVPWSARQTSISSRARVNTC